MKRFFSRFIALRGGGMDIFWNYTMKRKWKLSPLSHFFIFISFFCPFYTSRCSQLSKCLEQVTVHSMCRQAKPSLLRTLITTGCEGDWAKPENNRNLWVMLCRAWYRSDLRAETASKIGYPGPIILHWCTVLRIILICCWPTCNIITSNASDTVFSMRTWAAGDKKNCRRFGHWQACTVELESILLALAKQWRLWTFLLRPTSVLIKAQYPRHYQWLCHK